MKDEQGRGESPCVFISPGHGDHNQGVSQLNAAGERWWYSALPAEGEALAPCPFCGCDYADTVEASGLEVCNTHTPFFWVRCNACGCEARPEDHYRGADEVGDTEQDFIEARAAAVANWNRRDKRWRTRAGATP